MMTVVDDNSREVQEMVRRIIAHHFGAIPTQIVNQPSGRSNSVYQCAHAEGEFIIRLGPDSRKLNAFVKEQWATMKAREIGVPTHEILEVGNEIISRPYMISRQVVGHEATHHPERLRTIREMGRYAAQINSIPTFGFGRMFDGSGDPRFQSETWGDFLYNELNLESRLTVLERNRMLSPAQMERLRATLGDIAQWTFSPALNHGDLRLKNVVVNDEGGIIAILDWEHCMSNRAPHWELSLALHDLSTDEKQEFLAGYGLSRQQMAEMAPAVKAFNLVNYAPTIERRAEANDEERLEHYRTRLSGALDLYSL